MRAFLLPLLAATLFPAFSSNAFAGAPAPASDAKAAVSTAESAWSSTLLGFGVKTNDNYTDGNVFLTVPVYSSIGRDGKLGGDYLFIEPYSSLGTGGEVAASLGLAWRHLFSDQPVSALHSKGEASFMEEGWFIGGNLFLDMLDTQHNNQFWQLGVGAEIGNRYLQLSGNYYIPLTGQELAERNVSTRSFSNTSNSTRLTAAGDPFAAGNAILQNATYTTYANTTTTKVRTVTELFEQGMEGWDAQLAVLMPWIDQWVDLKLIGGYFSFDNQPFGPQSLGTGNVHGWKAGTEFRPVPAVILSAMWYQDERLTGGNWTVGAQLQIPLGKDWKDSFRMRRRHLVEELAEPVHRQNDAVKIGNEQEVRSTTSVKRTTKVVKQTPTQIVLKDDVVFVNHGGDVGNGIQAGSPTGDGTARNPVSKIEAGSDIAGGNSNSTGRVWNVYTQGNGVAYSQSVLVNTGSVNFIGSGSGIAGVGGKTFGKGPGPVLEGGFSADGIGFLGVTGYTITGGNNFPGSGAGIAATNVGTVVIQQNQILEILHPNDFPNSVELFTDGANVMRALISNNTIANTAISFSQNRLFARSEGGSTLDLTVANNTFSNAGSDAIHAESYDTSDMALEVSNNDFHTAQNDYINPMSFGQSTLTFSASHNAFHSGEESGIRMDSGDSSIFNFAIDSNSIENNLYSGIYGVARGTSVLSGSVTNNYINNNPGGVEFQAFDTSTIEVTEFDNNIILPSANAGRGITLGNSPGASVIVNGTVNNVVGAFFFGRLDGTFTPSGSFILNGATIQLPANAP